MSTFLIANSLVDGFLGSNAVGRGIVIIQLCLSVGMVAAIIGKWRELRFVASATRRFLRDFDIPKPISTALRKQAISGRCR